MDQTTNRTRLLIGLLLTFCYKMTVLTAFPESTVETIATDTGKSAPSSGEGGVEPNPPSWPDSVKMIRPTDDREKILSAISETQDPWSEEHGTFVSDHHFSDRRYAVLFAPGVYRGVDLEVGYYTQVLGLGKSADDVQFRDCERGPYVPALNRHLHAPHGTSLDTFWRSAENFASHASDGMRWAVSQAAPLRRVRVAGDLYLFDGDAYASGGHLANSRVDGHTFAGGQQQFLHRNVHFGDGTSGGAWSMVYVGCTGQVPRATPGGNASAAITVVEAPPVRVEKPYIALKEDGARFELRVPLPQLGKNLQDGPLLHEEHQDVRDFDSVRVVRPDEPVSRMQEGLDKGLDLVLAPGVFKLDKSLEIKHANQVVLGLGLATLVAPPDGSPCVRVRPGIPGVRLAGFMLEASERDAKKGGGGGEDKKSALLEWGEESNQKDPGSRENPGALFDVFCRVGGATMGNREAIFVDAMMRVHSGNVFADNLWLWRADHAELKPGEEANYPHISPLYWQSEQNEFRVETGLEVYGDDVTICGLAVEHANGHQTVWHGERGFVAFYQCELPYGVSHEAYGEKLFGGYVVNESVSDHAVHAPGVYSNFRNEPVVVRTAISHPDNPSVACVNPFTVRLDNHFGIESVANEKGPAATVQGRPVRMSDESFQ